MKKIPFIVLLLALPVFAASVIDINNASIKELDTLIGIGPTLAQRIIDGRPYYAVDDLLQVKGIGPTTLQKIQKQGLAYVSEEMRTQKPKPQSAPATTAPLPKPEKSDTTVNREGAPAALHLSTDPLHPLWLFCATLGSIIITGAGYIIWKYKLFSKSY